MFTVTPPDIVIDERGTIRSRTYDDAYASIHGTLDEIEHVFIRGNGLHRRFACASSITVGETGLGTGLNFLHTWRTFDKHAHADARLHYVAAEQSPLDDDQLRVIHDAFPELRERGDRFRQALPPRIPGFHRVLLDDPRVTLTVLYGGALETLAELHATVDAWFLDGFAPDRNPDMWSPKLCEQIARLTREGGTLATYTAAGAVRRGLIDAGFDITKIEGHGRKRHMITGTRNAQPARAAGLESWFHIPSARHSISDRTAVIGAGLAGSAMASSLARRGMSVEVFDPNPPATGGSSQRAGILQPTWSVDDPVRDSWFWSATALAKISILMARGMDATQLQLNGVDHRAVTDTDLEKQHQRIEAITKRHAIDSHVRRVDERTTRFELGGCASPGHLCGAYLNHHNITLTRRSIDTVPLADHDITIVAAAAASRNFEGLATIPLRRSRGQTTHLRSEQLRNEFERSCSFGGYVTAAFDGIHTLGSTHSIDDDDAATELRAQDHRANLDRLIAAFPNALIENPEIATLEGATGIRCVTDDRMPILGPAIDHSRFMTQFADLARGRPAASYEPAPVIDSTWIITALGSRGIASSALGGELIASMILGEPLPVPISLLRRILPHRFAVRDLRRATPHPWTRNPLRGTRNPVSCPPRGRTNRP